MEWLLEGVQTVSALCIAVSVIECVTGEGDLSDSLRMLCGAVVSLSIVRTAVRALQNLL